MRRPPHSCDVCGIAYVDFRTGYTYREVYHLIFERKYKRRHGVLGAWRQFKIELFERHIQECEGIDDTVR